MPLVVVSFRPVVAFLLLLASVVRISGLASPTGAQGSSGAAAFVTTASVATNTVPNPLIASWLVMPPPNQPTVNPSPEVGLEPPTVGGPRGYDPGPSGQSETEPAL
ncbi:hypothetical protein BDZ88DRAFT_412575 [Geranomyces variabilis]|nr:hypothetical protein BDZ88DRAFT_412575 [Geranomyces variabilis]